MELQQEYKGYMLKCHPKFPALKVITCIGSGKIPVILSGTYTSFKTAQDHIEQLLDTKVKPDAKENSAPRGKQVRKGSDNRSVAA